MALPMMLVYEALNAEIFKKFVEVCEFFKPLSRLRLADRFNRHFIGLSMHKFIHALDILPPLKGGDSYGLNPRLD